MGSTLQVLVHAALQEAIAIGLQRIDFSHSLWIGTTAVAGQSDSAGGCCSIGLGSGSLGDIDYLICS